MAETVTLPKLGFDMREGTFLNWVKKVGDQVNKGEVLAEIESDKATIEVESPFSGVLLTTLVKEGDVVPVDAPIATIGAAGESGGSAGSANGAAPAAQPAAKQQSSPEQEAPPATTPAAQPAQPADPEEEFLPDGVRASPIARRIAEERKVDLRQVRGTGPNGRITRQDVENYQAPAAAASAPAAAPATQPPAPAPAQKALAPAPQGGLSVPPHPVPPPIGAGMVEVPLTRLRQRIASRLVESKLTTPHFYITTEIEMDAALATRKQINESLDEAHKITVNDMIVKATALALRQYPNLNSHYYGDKVIRYDYINIGIAVAMDGGGLMNVVAKNADSTAISIMAARNKEIIAAARSGKVKPEDVEGSTFTTSNLGPFEVEQFVAIINPPEAGIVAVGSAKAIPVVVNGEIKIVTRMKATISADHRVTDGAEAAQFMQAFKKLLETPIRILV
jgi:pyruvate dehydrogenase E2 component (dihydrolipoamide acetyltransferase)